MIPLHTECISHNCTKKQMQGTLKIIPPLPSFLVGKTSHRITTTHILQYYPLDLLFLIGRLLTGFEGLPTSLTVNFLTCPKYTLFTFAGIPSSFLCTASLWRRGLSPARESMQPQACTHTEQVEPQRRAECMTTKRNKKANSLNER